MVLIQGILLGTRKKEISSFILFLRECKVKGKRREIAPTKIPDMLTCFTFVFKTSTYVFDQFERIKISATQLFSMQLVVILKVAIH